MLIRPIAAPKSTMLGSMSGEATGQPSGACLARQCAARLGCRPANLSRAFAVLRALGVETHGARVVLHDPSRLRSFAAPDLATDAEAGGPAADR